MDFKGQKYTLSQIGNYQLTGRCLGKGSFAKVYEAKHRYLNTTVALKTMNTTEMKDCYMLKHYKREAVLLSKLHHPAIVSLFEVMETKNHFCMALEYGGENLCDFVRTQKRGKLDELVARSMARQLASAVAHMHSRSVIHRDLKLENIMVNPDTRRVKIADFGLGNEWTRETLLTTYCGSPEYAAPELHSGKPYGFQVDVWALGVVLFAMVVGRLPFEVEMKKPVSNQHRRELFLDETKRGVKTMKHQTYMGSASFLFKDLVSKMLNPSSHQRLKIEKVEKHPWILGVFVEEFVPLDKDWRENAIEKLSRSYNIPVNDINEQLNESPYSQLGGIFNIEKHHYLTSKNAAARKATSAYKVRDLKITASGYTSSVHRPTTAINSSQASALRASQRPKSANCRTNTLKPLDNKLHGEIRR